MLVMAADWMVIIEQIYCGVTATSLTTSLTTTTNLKYDLGLPSPPHLSPLEQLITDFQVEIIKTIHAQ